MKLVKLSQIPRRVGQARKTRKPRAAGAMNSIAVRVSCRPVRRGRRAGPEPVDVSRPWGRVLVDMG
ncbi:hypothetical protein KFL01_01240 [Kocuria flava]|uniref:Uncharacterized protein n=1 Tax=Kocuria flava TaxID=446860 RepID=A0ABQ0X076_9MICC|nr:hypothetical protein KFL01_01240 [Kocuria flava]